MRCANPIRIALTLALATGLLADPAHAGKVTPQPINVVNQMITDALAAKATKVVIPKGLYMAMPGKDTTVLVNGPIEVVGKGVVIDSAYEGNCITVTSGNVTIRGFTLVNGLYGISGSGDHLRILKNRIESCQNDGISAGGDNTNIVGNRVTGCRDAGIYYSTGLPSSKASIRKNVVSQCDDEGIYASYGQLTVEQNRCYHNAGIGIYVEITVGGGASVSRNRCWNNLDDGIDAEIQWADALVRIDRNVSFENRGSGIFAAGVGADGFPFPSSKGFLIERNRCDRNAGGGIQLRADSVPGANPPCTLTRNRVQQNLYHGIHVRSSYFADPPAEPGNLAILRNTARANSWDGINVTGARNTILKNRCDRNLGDGIDLDYSSSVSLMGNRLEGNRCVRNGHEGIDNSGVDTVLIGNRTGRNAYGAGPDIATAGDVVPGHDKGAGTVAEAVNNRPPVLASKPGEGIPAVHDMD